MAIRRSIDHLLGTRIGRWALLREVGPPAGRKYGRFVECRCDCGNLLRVFLPNLQRGLSRSCGCFRNEQSATRSVTHGLSKTREYRIWTGMKQRCLDPGNPSYPHYGGRGIAIHPSWLDSFEAFHRDVGPAPSLSHTMDRINNDRGYEPGNVRWATKTQQANNCRDNHRLTVNGETRTLAEWAVAARIRPHALLHRLSRGWDLAAAVQTQQLTDTTRRTNHYITMGDQTHCIAEWARRTGIQGVTIHARLRLGWPVERTLTEPARAIRR